MTNFPEKIGSVLMGSIMAAFPRAPIAIRCAIGAIEGCRAAERKEIGSAPPRRHRCYPR